MDSNEPVAEVLVLHAEFVQRLAHALAGRAGDDLAQETWVRALTAKAPHGNVRGWLRTILGNVWCNRRRDEARRERRDQGAVPLDGVPAVDEIAEREEVRQRVVAAVLQLPEPMRAVVLLRFYEGLDSVAIAARLQRPATTVRSQLQAALQRLRQRLDHTHGERRAAWLLPLSKWSNVLTRTTSTVLRVAWPLRVGAVVLVLAITSLMLPGWLGGPPSPAPIVPVADAGNSQRIVAQEPDTRRVAPPSLAATVARGPEDLWGRVVTGTADRPVAGAVVELQYCGGDEFAPLDRDYCRQVDVLATANTDGDGRFAFRVTRARVHRLQVRAVGFAPTISFECVGGNEVTVRVAAGAAVGGVVRDAATDKPLAGVRVRVRCQKPDFELASAVTAEDGVYRFAMLPATRVGISADDERFVSSYERLDLQPASEELLDLKLVAGHVAQGRVTDAATGTPLADVQVSDARSFERRAITDAEGRYRLRGLPATQGSLMFARAEGYCMHWGVQAETEVDMQRDIAMVRAGAVRGRFVDVAGAGIAGLFAGVGATFEISIGEATDWCRAAVGSDGRFTIAGLDPRETYSLLVRGAGVGARVLVLPRPVVSGEVFDLGDVVLQPAAEFGGRVVDADGKALAGAEVYLQGLDASAWQLLGKHVSSLEVSEFVSRLRHASKEGTFCFGDLARGSYRLLVRLPGRGWNAEFGPYEVKDAEIHEPVRLTIGFGRVITGTVRLADGTPLPATHPIRLLATKGGRTQVTLIAGDGSFRFERLDEGDYDISVSQAPPGWALSVQRGVAANTKDLQLVLQRAATVEGRVVDAQGKPRRGRVICWFPHGGEDALADADGRFRFEVPADFVGHFTADDPDDERLQARIDDVVAGTHDLVLQLR